MTTAISTITLTTLSGRRMHASLTERAMQIATQLQHQLESVVAFDDHLTARELFDSYAGVRELDGIAVYADKGELIEGRGVRPEQLRSVNADLGVNKNHVIVVGGITSREGRLGRLYVSFSTQLNDEAQRRAWWIAAGIGGAVVLCALWLAVHTSRRITRRLVSIAQAADRMAAGDLSQATLDDRTQDEIGALAHAFNVMVSELNRMDKAHEELVSTERERLESLVTERTQALEQSREMFRLMAESTNAVPFTLDLTRGCFTYIGAQGIADSGIPESRWKEPGGLDSVVPRDTNPETRQRFDECDSGPFEFVTALSQGNGRHTEVRWTGTCERVGGLKVLRGLMLDITELRRLSRELAAAQKLESVGRLAAGVAHEINTPVQFVSDNVQFVRTSMTDVAAVIRAYRDLMSAAKSASDVAGAVQLAEDAEKAADLDYILQSAPQALDSSIEGLGRIATIVRSMKEFAHPDQAQKTLGDLNQALRSTPAISGRSIRWCSTC
jgi:signal transduction histidine kinase